MIASRRAAASSTTTRPIAQPMIQPAATATTIGLAASARGLVADQALGVIGQRARLGEVDTVNLLGVLDRLREHLVFGLTRDLGVADHTGVSALEAPGHPTS